MKYYVMIFRDIDYPNNGIEKLFDTDSEIRWCIGKKGSNENISSGDMCYIRKNKNGKNIVYYKTEITRVDDKEKNFIYFKKLPYKGMHIAKKDDDELYSALNVKMFTGFGEISQKVAKQLDIMGA